MNAKYTELLEAARPLIKWLNDNYHPHCRVIVDCASVELVEGVTKQRCYDYIGDGEEPRNPPIVDGVDTYARQMADKLRVFPGETRTFAGGPVALHNLPPVSSCGYCEYEEADGELIKQCPSCFAKDHNPRDLDSSCEAPEPARVETVPVPPPSITVGVAPFPAMPRTRYLEDDE